VPWPGRRRSGTGSGTPRRSYRSRRTGCEQAAPDRWKSLVPWSPVGHLVEDTDHRRGDADQRQCRFVEAGPATGREEAALAGSARAPVAITDGGPAGATGRRERDRAGLGGRLSNGPWTVSGRVRTASSPTQTPWLVSPARSRTPRRWSASCVSVNETSRCSPTGTRSQLVSTADPLIR